MNRSLSRMNDMADYLTNPTGRENLNWSTVGRWEYKKWYEIGLVLRGHLKEGEWGKFWELLESVK
jgi:hypothetical protein